MQKPNSISLTSSIVEPYAWSRNRAKSREVPRPAPSAILELMEMTARRICEVSPYFSWSGKPPVAAYIGDATASVRALRLDDVIDGIRNLRSDVIAQ